MPDSNGLQPPPPPERKPDFERDTKTSDYWVIAIIIVSVAFVLVAVLSQFFDWHWLYNLWFNYSWSSDKGNGPEALQQTVVYALVAALFVPVVRKFIAKHVNDIKHSIHIHGTEITAHLHHITEAQGLPKFEHSDEYKAHVAEHEAKMMRPAETWRAWDMKCEMFLRGRKGLR